MKIVVTGGAGFIGSNIVDAYIAKGHSVAVLDNLVHGWKTNLHPKARFYQVDIRNLTAVRKVLHKEKPDVINHHAAIAEVVKSVSDPIPTLETNVQGTVNLLLTGQEVGIKKFIFASTGGAIYGNAKRRPTTEQAATEPLSPYGLSKLLAEQCIEYYARLGKFNYVIFRYPNVYGPRQDPHGEAGVVAIFSQLLHNNQVATIFGNGRKTRDYVYVHDIARANVLALRKGQAVIINLGRGQEISDQTVFATIHKHFPTAPKIRYAPIRSGEVLHSSLQAARAKTVLGWQAKFTFAQGVAAYLKTL